jgi:diguanylate cyclase (GGDEF)-like protein
LSREAGAAKQSDRALRAQLEIALRAHLRESHGASGIGIWYEPGILTGADRSFSSHFRTTDENSIIKAAADNNRSRDYRNEPWFGPTLGENWTPADHTPGQTYWSPVYFDFDTKRVVLTLVSPIFDKTETLIGMVTTDWASDQIIDLVSRLAVTDNSFSFLNDRNNRNLSSLSRSKDSLLEQKIIDAILAKELSVAPPKLGLAGSSSVQAERLHTRLLEISGREYELYYAATPGGMIYGAGVPQDEIERVLLPMRYTNYQILVMTGTVIFILGLFVIYRIVRLVRELQASYTDDLTGLPNRARLLKDLKNHNEACLIVVNLDRFQEINGLFGNACGDQVLQTLGNQLTSFSKNNRHSFRTHVYRLPGDEFALLGPVIAEASIRAFVSTIIDFLRSHRVIWKQQPLSVDSTVGVAYHRPDPGTAAREQLLSQATVALNLARAQQRNYLIYDSEAEIEKGFEHNLYWAQRLKDALEQNQLEPYFQPIYDNRAARVSKYECLARIVESDGDAISAGQFLNIANKLRLDRQITRVMIAKSFAKFSREPYEFSINLSYPDLVEPEILELILGHLKDSGIGERVIFEILESDGIENYNEVLYFIEQVKPFGCQIAIDDFGTGYSNFEQLLRLNIDIIKIDGSLIQHLHEDHTAFVITQGIVQFARSLGIQTVAEFVHNEAVQSKVVELGIDFSQGAYFSMPGPVLRRSH